MWLNFASACDANMSDAHFWDQHTLLAEHVHFISSIENICTVLVHVHWPFILFKCIPDAKHTHPSVCRLSPALWQSDEQYKVPNFHWKNVYYFINKSHFTVKRVHTFFSYFVSFICYFFSILNNQFKCTAT